MILTVCYVTQAVAKDRPERDSNPDLCDAGIIIFALPVELSGQLGAVHYVGQ